MTEQEALDRYVATNLRWNFSVNVIDVGFYILATNVVSMTTILPLLVTQLTSSPIAVGLIPAIYSLGLFLPQLLFSNLAEQLRRKKPFVVTVSTFGERLPYLLMGLVVWKLAETQPTLTLALFFLLFATTATATGVLTPAWSDLIAKVIPVTRRGAWAGASFGLGAITGVVGAALAGRALATRPFSENFALCFGMAVVALAISWVGLVANREPDSPVVKPHLPLARYFRKLPQVLYGNPNYVHYIVSRSVSSLGGMAAGFIMVYGVERFGFGGREVGLLTAIMVGSQAIMNPLWGMLGDRAGHKVVLSCAAFTTALAALAAWAAQAPAGIMVCFALLGAGIAADTAAGLNIVMEFSPPEDRPTYIGLSSTLLAPSRAIAPIIGGVLAALVGYRSMFAVASILALCGGLLLALWVREPRHIQREAPAPSP